MTLDEGLPRILGLGTSIRRERPSFGECEGRGESSLGAAGTGGGVPLSASVLDAKASIDFSTSTAKINEKQRSSRSRIECSHCIIL